MSRLLGPIAAVALLLSYTLYFGTAGASAAATPTPAPTVWGCFPGQTPDPCEGSQATTYLSSTVIQPRKVARVETPPASADPGVDCFYVYPTVSSALSVNAPRHITADITSIYRYQAARFSQACTVYAPIYRQATLVGIAAPVAGSTKAQDPTVAHPLPAFDLAYSDVVSAWHDYLANDNHGRGVVLIGHSQGSAMLIRLMHEEIDQTPAERALLVSAIVPGGNLAVAQGERTGGDLDTIPTCATGTETGCVIAYSTFSKQPGLSSVFGRTKSSLRSSAGLPTRPGVEVACVNPATLSGDNGHLLTFTRSEPFGGLIGIALQLMYLGLTPKASTPWISPGERYTAGCVHSNGAHVLMVKRASWPTVLPLASPTADWGLHLADINLPLGNLVKIVQNQAAAYLAAHPSTPQTS